MIYSGNSNTTFWFGLGLNSLCYCKKLVSLQIFMLGAFIRRTTTFWKVSVEAVESGAAQQNAA